MNSQEINKLASKQLENSGVNAIYNFSNRTPHVTRFFNPNYKGEFNSIVVSNYGLLLMNGIVPDDDPNEITSFIYLTKLYEILF